MEEEPTKIEDFNGVYLLCSKSSVPRYKGRCYIGYTVNPNRRIKQHNRGVDFGGAKKTNNKGPWVMVMIVHGFPNNITALQFEWAWQWPSKSTRLKNYTTLGRKSRKETYFHYHFRILAQMLNTGPWNRLPLRIRWFASEYEKDFPTDNVPPPHMKIEHGPVLIKKKPKNLETEETNPHKFRLFECHLCMKRIDTLRSKVTCLNTKCILTCHITCLADICLEPGHYVPIKGTCPICDIEFLWGDLIRKKNGCNDLEFVKDLEVSTDDNDSNSESDISILSDNNIPCTSTDNVEIIRHNNLEFIKDVETSSSESNYSNSESDIRSKAPKNFETKDLYDFKFAQDFNPASDSDDNSKCIENDIRIFSDDDIACAVTDNVEFKNRSNLLNLIDLEASSDDNSHKEIDIGDITNNDFNKFKSFEHLEASSDDIKSNNKTDVSIHSDISINSNNSSIIQCIPIDNIEVDNYDNFKIEKDSKAKGTGHVNNESDIMMSEDEFDAMCK